MKWFEILFVWAWLENISQGNLVPISAGLEGADLTFVSALFLIEVSDLHRFPVGTRSVL